MDTDKGVSRYGFLIVLVIIVVVLALAVTSEKPTEAQGSTVRVALLGDFGVCYQSLGTALPTEPAPTYTPFGGATPTPYSNTPTPIPTRNTQSCVTQQRVRDLVAGMNASKLLTVGDNTYSGPTTAGFLTDVRDPYKPLFGNNVRPSIGDEDNEGTGFSIYLGTFNPWVSLFQHTSSLIPTPTPPSSPDPNGSDGRYYHYKEGEFLAQNGQVRPVVHFFVLNSDEGEPHGREEDSDQAEWMINEMKNSTACFKVVYFHEPPYSTHDLFGNGDGGEADMRWHFRDYGVDAVLSGDKHHFEVQYFNGVIYVIDGMGGANLTAFRATKTPPGGSTATPGPILWRQYPPVMGTPTWEPYRDDHGGELIRASVDTKTGAAFLSSTLYVVDTDKETPPPIPTRFIYSWGKIKPCDYVPPGLITPTPTATAILPGLPGPDEVGDYVFELHSDEEVDAFHQGILP